MSNDNKKDNYEVYNGLTGGLIKAWVKGVEFESNTLDQLKNTACLPFIYKWIAAMPDAHLGKGSTVGSVIPTKGAIIPAAVGVDIGCTDKDTEFLSDKGWKKISEYEKGDLVMQYDADTGVGKLVKPERYIVKDCEEFYDIKTKYGVNQRLSPEHKVLFWKIEGRDRRLVRKDYLAEDFVSQHNDLKQGMKGFFETSFSYDSQSSVDLTDAQIRVQVMTSADSHLDNGGKAVVRFKKSRKIDRATEILQEAGIEHKIFNKDDGIVDIRYRPPVYNKNLKELFWNASSDQLKLISDECLYWDGSIKDGVFYTRQKDDADLIHFAFAVSGKRSVMREDIHIRDGKVDYCVFCHEDSKVGISSSPKSEIGTVKSEDGKSYCFTVPSGYWVMRRGGNIAMTGNCGMMATKTTLKANDLPDNLSLIRTTIEKACPHGRESWANRSAPKTVDKYWAFLDEGYKKIIKKYPKIAPKQSPMDQLGSLGGGNHFIEICLDENEDVWIMLHSGSRGVGNRIGSFFIEQAKKHMEANFIRLPDKDLAYLAEGSEMFNDYFEALMWAQNFAKYNREVMLENLVTALKKSSLLPQFLIDKVAVQCHHNYVAKENHFGNNIYLTRKGAVSAREGQLGIIPGSMGAKSFIVRGKGNLDSFCSCSHGAGRKMSRSQAKKVFTIEDHAKATDGVECRKDESVLDETPGAYKDIEAVMEAQKDLVDIVHTLKQVVCVKG